ncbi:phosphogluconate dehydrogenase C-terminal domain-containing protein [Robertmurraya massiliosenegalensis]|uniref:phosphogluconate dehydrogenase C-terminal domain-containing protein n=1 Tax=Robertmurraya TaxID=2837507 RepID=UPI0039A62B5E
MKTIALIGAGGKMGCRITDNLKDSDYHVLYVEIGQQGIENLAARGITPTPTDEAVSIADAVILAVPDVAIRTVSSNLIPKMKSGALIILLDPAAAFADSILKREDINYFIAHPCHPPLFNDETTEEARRDYFGGIKAKQAIVCALMQGNEEDYLTGEKIAIKMYAPVLRAHRVTIEQMAILEPTMAETVGATMAIVLKEAMDEAVKRGVPAEAARDFMLGHINIELAIAFGEAGNPFSDAALVAIEYGKKHLLKENWRDLFDIPSVKEQINIMLHPEKLEQVKA